MIPNPAGRLAGFSCGCCDRAGKMRGVDNCNPGLLVFVSESVKIEANWILKRVLRASGGDVKGSPFASVTGTFHSGLH